LSSRSNATAKGDNRAAVDALVISADDFGYAPAYDSGILEAVDAGAIDAVSVIAGRQGLDPFGLALAGVELGLHLELPVARAGLAGGVERRAALAAFDSQLESFRRAFRREPAFLDGHKHCHAAPGLAALVGRRAVEHGLVVRSVDARHRELLRSLGASTPDLLIGRMDEREPALPAAVNDVLLGGRGVEGVVEWMVHPGHPVRAAGSAYDQGRGEDLRLLLRLAEEPAVRRLRATHAEALA
jgi:predicted glycoside hydrolase/deacetylase ChbG (UPF0249 family)